MRKIKSVAILGSGIMGSRIACHFANTGIQVLLLDMAPKELNEEEKKKGLELNHASVQNRIVNQSLQTAIKTNPNPIYKKEFINRIQTGNFTADMHRIGNVDWIIEVVIENMSIKKLIFEEVEKYRKPGTLVTTNTSGIPIHMLTEGRSVDFQKHFCGTHFFNPPRYLQLLEIIPSPHTSPEVVDFLMEYGDIFLGKKTVLCNDTPAFIANRIGIFSIMSLFHMMEKSDLTIEEVDKLTGPALGRPKSATFRTCDVVGLDTLVHVSDFLYANCVSDEHRDIFKIPSYIASMSSNKWLGDKTAQGFYKKVKSDKGSEILALDLKTLEYRVQQKVSFPTLEAGKQVEKLRDRLKLFVKGKDKAGDFYRESFYHLFQYVSNRIPEITSDLYKIDAAMHAGFGWELGPFETWDALGVEETVKAMEDFGCKPAQWVYDMLASGRKSFYVTADKVRSYYDISSKVALPVAGEAGMIILDNLRHQNVVWKNAGSTLFDIGDGILNLEFNTKMNTIGGEVVEGVNKAIDLAEKEYRGLVIGNQAANFSAGANLAMIFMFAVEQDFDDIDYAARVFQKMNMRIRYSSIPVVVAPHGLTLGGGCEMCLHADHVQAAAETYIGLVEMGAGLIPGGGGTKEFALLASDAFTDGDIQSPILRDRYMSIAMAKVSTSAFEAFDNGILAKGRDGVTMNRERLIAEAKAEALRLADAGYRMPAYRNDIRVLGKSALGMFYSGAANMHAGNYISEYDKFISEKLAYVICGGDLSAPSLVSEQYLLDLEREAFLSLCGQKKTLERIQSLLKTGKPLRN